MGNVELDLFSVQGYPFMVLAGQTYRTKPCACC